MERRRLPLILVALAATALLSACEPVEEDEDLDPSLRGCATIAGTGTGTQPTCTGCTTTDATDAADGDAGTFATISLPANQAASNGAVKVTASSAVTFASGTQVGLLHSITYGTSTGVSVTLKTRNNAADAETFVVSGSSSAQGDSSNPTRVSFVTSAPYDEVELNFTRTGGAGTVTARVHEFCSNSP